MDQNLLLVQTIFVIIAAIALLLQFGILFAISKAVRAMQERVNSSLPAVDQLVQKVRNETLPKVNAVAEAVQSTIPRVDALVESAKATVDESRRHIVEVTGKASEILDATKVQLAKVDVVVTDATQRAKAQMDRVEMVIDDTMGRAQETVNAVSRGILWPVKEIQGVVAGVQAALGQLMRGGRPSVDRATSDEEMFI